MFVGLTGTLGSGKDTVAEYLKKKGFSYYSLSDILRDECEKRGLEKNRDNLIKIGNELRKEFGPDILAKKILEKIEKNKVKKAIIVSIRNPKEAEALKEKKGFFMLNIDAPIEIRFQRIKKRGGDRDKVSFEKFREQENFEMSSNDPNSQQLKAVAQMTDYDINNSGSLKDLYGKVDEIVNSK